MNGMLGMTPRLSVRLAVRGPIEPYHDEEGGVIRRTDAEFIVIARSAFPELIAEIRRLRTAQKP